MTVPVPAPAVIDARAVVSPEVAALPGAIWYVVEDQPPTKLYRLAGGTSVALGESIFPSALRLGDKLIAIRSPGTGEPGSEQALAVAADGAITPLGTAASQIRDPALDAGGAWIVIAANLDGHSELYRIDVAKPGTMTAITRNVEGNFQPSALGAKAVVFSSSRDGDSEIYRTDVDGTHVQRLTAFYKDDWGPVAAPDGKTIAFLSDREGQARVFLMAADGTGQRRLTTRADPGEEANPVWSPDGKTIAYLAQNGVERNLVIHDVATGADREVTPDDARDADPCFSPDGAWIVVARGTVRGDGEDHELWAIPTAAGKPALQLTAGGGSEGLPRWTP